jgi:hypothetical protein
MPATSSYRFPRSRALEAAAAARFVSAGLCAGMPLATDANRLFSLLLIPRLAQARAGGAPIPTGATGGSPTQRIVERTVEVSRGP